MLIFCPYLEVCLTPYQVYLDAWKYVASGLAQSSAKPSPALTALVDNWTNAEFEKFVNDLAGLVDE